MAGKVTKGTQLLATLPAMMVLHTVQWSTCQKAPKDPVVDHT